MANKKINVLIVDSSPEDVQETINALSDWQQPIEVKFLDDPIEVQAALQSENYQLILSELHLGNHGAAEILASARQFKPAIPVIITTKETSENEYRQIMAAGAADFITKGRWRRLVPAITRELRTYSEQLASLSATESLVYMEERYRAMVENSQEAVAYCHNGQHIDANAAYLNLFSYADLDELKGIPLLNLIEKKYQERLTAQLSNLNKVSEGIECLAVGNDGKKFPIEVVFAPLNLAGEKCTQVIVKNIAERKALENKIQFLYQRDPLTRLCNRQYFVQELGKAIEHAKAGEGNSALLCLELHHLRDINQNLGHASCDRLLLMLARQLREQIGNEHLLGRVGGGQFAILLNAKASSEAVKWHDKIEAIVKAFKTAEEQNTVDFQFSINLLQVDNKALDRQKLLTLAFTPAKPAAQPQATNTVHAPTAANEPTSAASLPVIEPVIQAENKNSISLESQEILAKALEKNTLKLFFQPITNLHGEAREYYEAQVFRQDENANSLPISLTAELASSELASKLDRWVAQHGVNSLKNHGKINKHAALFCTLSPMALKDSILLQAIQQHMKTTGVNPANLYFQIDVSWITRHTDITIAFMKQVKKIGAGLVLDNFDARLCGWLERGVVPIDFIKVSNRNLDTSNLRDLVAAAKSVETKTIVKDIDDPEIFSKLWESNVHYMQGDGLAASAAEMSVQLENEHTLSSDKPSSGSWQAAG